MTFSSADLQALRRLMFYSVEDAARFLASSPDRPEGVEPRSWQAWERGRRIPQDVQSSLSAAMAYRASVIERYTRWLGGLAPMQPVGLAWFSTIEDWCVTAKGMPDRAPGNWRPFCSALADLRVRHPNVRLVAFDSPSFYAWIAAQTEIDSFSCDVWATSMILNQN